MQPKDQGKQEGGEELPESLKQLKQMFFLCIMFFFMLLICYRRQDL